MPYHSLYYETPLPLFLMIHNHFPAIPHSTQYLRSPAIHYAPQPNPTILYMTQPHQLVVETAQLLVAYLNLCQFHSGQNLLK